MKRIAKHEARKRFTEGKQFFIVACKLQPYGGWGFGTRVRPELYGDHTFNELVDKYKAVNCTWETGYYPAYYT